jgi:hypothetical protein
MALPINGQVGGSAAQAVGTNPTNLALRIGSTSELIVDELHGRYYETTVRKAMYSGANLTGITTTAAFATTYTGMCLSNPIGSTVNLVLTKVTYAPVVAQTAALVMGIMTGYSASVNVTHTTPLVPLSNFVGQPAGTGLIDSSATLPVAPTRLILLGTLTTGAITQTLLNGSVTDMEGSVVIPPGGYAAIYTSAASVGSSLAFGMMWEEVSVTI